MALEHLLQRSIIGIVLVLLEFSDATVLLIVNEVAFLLSFAAETEDQREILRIAQVTQGNPSVIKFLSKEVKAHAYTHTGHGGELFQGIGPITGSQRQDRHRRPV